MIFAMSNIAWPAERSLAAYAAMNRHGVNGLEIAPGILFSESDDPFRPKRTEIGRAMADITSAGLRLVSMQSLLYGVEGAELFGEADARALFLQGMNRAVDLAGELEIPNLVFGSPKQRVVPAGMTGSVAELEAAELFFKLGDRAAAAGTVISVEANPSAYGTNFLNTHEQASTFVARVSHPAIRLVLDLGAVALNGESVRELAVRPEVMRMVNHVHVSEPNLLPAPTSPELLVETLRVLKMVGYTGAVSIEMKQQDGGLTVIQDCLALLKSAAEAGGVA